MVRATQLYERIDPSLVPATTADFLRSLGLASLAELPPRRSLGRDREAISTQLTSDRGAIGT